MTQLSPNVAGNMFESIDGRLSGRCSLHEFRTACDFRTPASCGTCHQDGGGKGCGIHLFECQCAFSQFDDTISLRTIPDCFTPLFLPGCRMIISNVTARPYSSGNSISEHLKQHMTMPVRWTESMHYLLLHRITEVIEMGPNNVLSGLLRKQRITLYLIP